jgi:hypothetical protein
MKETRQQIIQYQFFILIGATSSHNSCQHYQELIELLDPTFFSKINVTIFVLLFEINVIL